jgi:hypothetical protein
MKSLLPLVLWAICASAYSLTIDEIAGKWVVDIDATMSLMKEQYRKKMPPGMDENGLAMQIEPRRGMLANRIFEFAPQTILVHQERDGAMMDEQNITITSKIADKDALIVECQIPRLKTDSETTKQEVQNIKLVLRLRGDRLEMDTGKNGQVIVLLRPVADAAKP